MYPEHPTPPNGFPPSQPQTPLPADFLNQIAPQPRKKSLFTLGPKLFAVLGGLVVLVIIVAVTINVIAAGQRQPLERLAARLSATETIATDAQAHLKGSQLRSLNSTLRLYLTNVNRDIGETMSAAGVDTAKLSGSVVDAESTEEMANRLEDARLNAVYDRTYSREMAYQLATTLALLQEIFAGNYSDDIKAFASEVYNNLQPTHEALDSYDAS